MNGQHVGDARMHEHTHCNFKSVSWTAIIVGALVGIGLSFLFNLFSVAIGLSSFTVNQEGLTVLAIGGFIGLLIAAIVSMFVAGYVAGYLGRPYCTRRHLGVVYGFVTWCLMLVLSVMLASQVAGYVAAYSAAVNSPNVAVDTRQTGENAPVATTNRTAGGEQQVTVNAEKATNAMGMSAFVIFILFFIGALSACFGGHFGMLCRSDDADMHRTRV